MSRIQFFSFLANEVSQEITLDSDRILPPSPLIAHRRKQDWRDVGEMVIIMIMLNYSQLTPINVI